MELTYILPGWQIVSLEKLMKWPILFVLVMLATGCSITPEMINVGVQDPKINPQEGRMIVVGPVEDARKSQLLSSFPDSTYHKSVGGVARAGNGSNVMLESTTVANKTKSIIIQALRQMGYKTVTKCNNTCPKLSTTLKTFIVKAPFNFWRALSFTQHMVADISVVINFKNHQHESQFTVSGHGENIYQVIDKDNWETAVNSAIKDFVENFKQTMALHSE